MSQFIKFKNNLISLEEIFRVDIDEDGNLIVTYVVTNKVPFSFELKSDAKLALNKLETNLCCSGKYCRIGDTIFSTSRIVFIRTYLDEHG